MADPKLMRIAALLSGRLAGIRKANGFYTDIGRLVERYPRSFNDEESPACVVYLSNGSVDESAGMGVKTSPQLTIRATEKFGDEQAEDVAIKMLADIHKAVEVPSSTIPQQPYIIRQFDEASWQIIHPENLSGTVSVDVIYTFSYSRKYGED